MFALKLAKMIPEIIKNLWFSNTFDAFSLLRRPRWPLKSSKTVGFPTLLLHFPFWVVFLDQPRWPLKSSKTCGFPTFLTHVRSLVVILSWSCYHTHCSAQDDPKTRQDDPWKRQEPMVFQHFWYIFLLESLSVHEVPTILVAPKTTPRPAEMIPKSIKNPRFLTLLMHFRS